MKPIQIPTLRTRSLCSLILLCALLCFGTAGEACAASLNVIQSVTFTSCSDTDKIAIYLRRPISFKSRSLDRNAEHNLPYRLYIDLLHTRLPSGFDKVRYPDSVTVEKIRIAQRNKSTARVVFDIQRKIYRDDYTIRQFENPARIEIDFKKPRTASYAKKDSARQPGTLQTPAEVSKKQSTPEQNKVAAPVRRKPRSTVSAPPHEKTVPASAPVSASVDTKPADDGICVIVIDPGHGGHDPGAIGYRGMKEKDVCLAIARELKKIIDKNATCKAVLTRTDDSFLSLDERSAIANARNADLFISIHANSHRDRKLRGIETYYLNFSSDDTARKVAARENFTTPSQISDLEMILFDLMQSDKINKSSIFAGYIHNSLIGNLKNRYSDLRNLGVKHAPMRVLIDAEMPCVLIETAFISNPTEAGRLKSKKYQKVIASAILEGIGNYNVGHKTALYTTSR